MSNKEFIKYIINNTDKPIRVMRVKKHKVHNDIFTTYAPMVIFFDGFFIHSEDTFFGLTQKCSIKEFVNNFKNINKICGWNVYKGKNFKCLSVEQQEIFKEMTIEINKRRKRYGRE